MSTPEEHHEMVVKAAKVAGEVFADLDFGDAPENLVLDLMHEIISVAGSLVDESPSGDICVHDALHEAAGVVLTSVEEEDDGPCEHDHEPEAVKPGFYILSAEFVGHAKHGPGGILRIGEPDENGEGVVEINLARTGLDPKGYCCWWNTHSVGVYVRRSSDDLSVLEIHMARHDGLAQEELDRQNDEAARYPLGAKEYWRSVQVGKYTYGPDGHLMTDEEFEADWGDE